MLSDNTLKSFLTFGYDIFADVPNIELQQTFCKFCLKNSLERNHLDLRRELVTEGANIIKSSLIKELSKLKPPVVIPISGGADSRILLGAALSVFNIDEIYTLTFGTRGTLDYEIGNLVARTVGTQHHALDLAEINYSPEDLIITAKVAALPVNLIRHWTLKALSEFPDDATWLIGFMGGELAGSHLPKKSEEIDLKCASSFINKESLSYGISTSWLKEYDVQFIINQGKYSKLSNLQESMDFQIRQLKFVYPMLTLGLNKYKFPFLQESITGFLLNLDVKYRKKQNLYFEIANQIFPELFNLPQKHLYGGNSSSSIAEIGLRRVYNFSSRKLGINDYAENFVDYKDLYKYNKSFKETLDYLNQEHALSYRLNELVSATPQLENEVSKVIQSKEINDKILLGSLCSYILSQSNERFNV